GPMTARDRLVECEIVALVPVTVRVEDPSGAEDGAGTVIVMLPPPLIVGGEKTAVAPVGMPLTLGVIRPTQPLPDADVLAYVVVAPCTTVAVVGDTAMVKSAPLGTICTPLTGARGKASLDVPAAAVSVKPVPLMPNLT